MTRQDKIKEIHTTLRQSEDSHISCYNWRTMLIENWYSNQKLTNISQTLILNFILLYLV